MINKTTKASKTPHCKIAQTLINYSRRIFIARREETAMKLNRSQHRVYNIVMSALAILAAILVLIELSQGLCGWQVWAERAILGIFTIDYFVRLYIAPDKWHFFTSNICDLIAIFPFHTIFRAFRLLKAFPLLVPAGFSAFAGLPRVFAFTYRPLKKAHTFFNTNSFKYIVFAATVMILFGGILIHFAEGMSYADGIWWAFVTTTTVGYGDISPTTFYGRLIAMFLMLIGIGMIGSITSTLTSYFLKTEARGVKNEAIENIKAQLDHFDELSCEDVDAICRILKALKKT